MATIQFVGALHDKIELFGRVLYNVTEPFTLIEAIPNESKVFSLPAGLDIMASENDGVVEVQLQWEGLPILSETLSLASSRNINIEPLPGVQLVGTLSIMDTVLSVPPVATPSALGSNQGGNQSSAPEFPDQDPNVP